MIFIKTFLVFILLLPYLIIFSTFHDWSVPDFPALILYKTFLQGFWSSLIAIAIGFLGALGLIRYQGNKTFLEMFIVLPSFFPSLFVIFSLLSIFSFLPFDFPYGFTGIVMAHTLIYSGLVSVMLAKSLQESCGAGPILARLFGHSQKSIFFYVLLPSIKRDLFTVFLMLLCLCLGSFSIPLILGGGQWVTTEMAIYELIRFEGHINAAALLSLYQIFILLFFIYLLPHFREKKQTWNCQDIGFKYFIYLPLSITVLLLCACFGDLITGWPAFATLLSEPLLLFKPLSGSLLIGFLTGLMVLLILAMMALVGYSILLDKFYLLFMMPSTAVMGFALLFLSYYLHWELRSLMQVAFLNSLGLCLLSLGGLYRWKWSTEILRLESQRTLARLMGHHHWSIFLHIIWPQSQRLAWQLAGLAAFWAVGDFTLSLMLFKDSNSTLPLLLSNMLSRYQFTGASWILLLMLLVGCFAFWIFNSKIWLLGKHPR